MAALPRTRSTAWHHSTVVLLCCFWLTGGSGGSAGFTVSTADTSALRGPVADTVARMGGSGVIAIDASGVLHLPFPSLVVREEGSC